MGLFSRFLDRIIPWRRSLAGSEPIAGGSLSPPSQPPEVPPSSPFADVPNSDWLYSGTWLHMFSSNVEAARYLWDVMILEIHFKGEDSRGEGYWYQYFGVPPNIASEVSTTASPGRFVWDRLRIRGTKEGHQYEYVRMHGLPGVSKKPTVGGALPESMGVGAPFGLVPPWQGRAPWQVKT